MKFLATLISLLTFMAVPVSTSSVHEFTMSDINGNTVDLKSFEGNVLLIVNTASECGFTPQYDGLQALYEEYKDQGLYVLGFPANNFGGQEPGTDKEIKKFCKVNYDVTFPMFSKISVKGDDKAPLFEYLTAAENPDFTGPIKWNFEKFLISKDGKLLHRFRSKVKPQSEEITNALELALNK